MKIHLHCPLNPTGFGVHMQYLVDELLMAERHGHVELELFPRGTVHYSTNSRVKDSISAKLMSQRPIEPDIVVIADLPSICGRSLYMETKARKKVAYTVFETASVELGCLSGFDSIWVPSEWAKKVVLTNAYWLPSFTSVHVVPEGVEPFDYFERESPYDETLSIASVGKFEVRKGQDVLLNVLERLYRPFNLFTYWNNYWAPGRAEDNLRKRGWRQATDLIGLEETRHQPHFVKPGGKRVFLGNRKDNLSQVWSSLNFCDIAVFPHRGEGWGLPILEAIASGIPTAATYQTGPTEYLKAYYEALRKHGLPAKKLELDPADSTPVYDPPFFDEGASWLAPSEDCLGSLLNEWQRPTYEEREKYNEVAKDMAVQFSWTRSAARFIGAAEEVVRGKG